MRSLVAKGLRDFARTHPHLVIKGGVLDGQVPGARRGSQARGPRVARGAAGQGRRRHEGHPAAGDLVDLRTAVPDRPAAGRAGGGRQGEPLADRRPGSRVRRAEPTWTRTEPSRSDADEAEPSEPTWLPRRTPRNRATPSWPLPRPGPIWPLPRPGPSCREVPTPPSPAVRTGRCARLTPNLQLPLRRSILQLPLQTRRRPSPPAIPRQRPLRKTTRKGRPSWRSSAPPSSLTPSRSSP